METSESLLLVVGNADGYIEEIEVPDRETAMAFYEPAMESGVIVTWKLYNVVVTKEYKLLDEG